MGRHINSVYHFTSAISLQRFRNSLRPTAFATVLIPLLLVLSVIPLDLPAVSALGCPPDMHQFESEGPYASSLTGFADIGSRIVENEGYNVFTVEPGSVASMKFAIKQLVDFPFFNLTLRPVVRMPSYEISPRRYHSISPGPSWLGASFDPEIVAVPQNGSVYVTATFEVSKDAPLGEYLLMIAGEELNAPEWDRIYCPYAPLYFFLRVASEKKAIVTVTQTTTITATSTLMSTATTTIKETVTKTTSTTTTSVERVTEPSIYAWAVGATIIAIALAAVLILRKRRI